MTDFAIYDASGTILRSGSVPENEVHLQVRDGEHLFVGVVGERDRIDVASKSVIANAIPARRLPPAPAPRPPDPPYIQRRRRAYPTIEQQLDWLWHAMDDGLLPRVEPMYSQIGQVKALYPKTVDLSDGQNLTEVL